MRRHLSDLSLDTVETGILNCLERPWEKQHDPCDEIIVECAGLTSPKIGTSRERKHAWLRERLDVWISRTDAHSLEEARRRLPERVALGDPEMFRLMLEGGVNPHALLLLAMTGGAPMTTEIGDGLLDEALANMSIAPGPDGWFEIMVQIGPGVHWSGERIMARSDIVPDTMITLLEGRRLGEVVDHPALRVAGPIISTTTHANGFLEMRVEGGRRIPFRAMDGRHPV